jgi:hypothetical protein
VKIERFYEGLDILTLPEASFEEKTFFNIVNKEGITLPQMSEE